MGKIECIEDRFQACIHIMLVRAEKSGTKSNHQSPLTTDANVLPTKHHGSNIHV